MWYNVNIASKPFIAKKTYLFALSSSMTEETAEKRGSAIGARITPSLRLRIDQIHKRQGTNDAALLEDLLTAACNYASVRGFYERPVKVVFDEEAAGQQRYVLAEAPGEIPQQIAQAELKKKEGKRAAAKGGGNGGAGERS